MLGIEKRVQHGDVCGASVDVEQVEVDPLGTTERKAVSNCMAEGVERDGRGARDGSSLRVSFERIWKVGESGTGPN
jgi:hypothetical protein